MKKALRTLVTFLESNRDDAAARSEKERRSLKERAPKAVLLTSPGDLPSLTTDPTALYVVESLGNAVKGCEATLDHALRRLELPLLIIVGGGDDDVLDRAVKVTAGSDAEKAVYEAIVAGLDGHVKAGRKRTLSHIDGQVTAALERYNDLVKKEKLVVIGAYHDDEGQLFITNYNGLKGKDALAYGLPDVDDSFFWS